MATTKSNDGTDGASASKILEAVKEGDVDGVREFLKAGGDVNLSTPSTGRTLLHVSSRQGYPELVSLLLSHGANPSATTLRHLAPLHLAAHEGHFKVARLLLESWAPVDDRDRAGTTPLHLAAQRGNIDVVRLLLQCGSDKNGLDESGWAPLHFAVWKGHTAVARMLLQAGANARACDRREKTTPLHLACAWGHPEVAKTLLEFGADSSAVNGHGALADHVIGTGCPDEVEPACARKLGEIVVGHRTRMKSRGASSSLECVVDSLRAKVSELEDQLARARRDRLELMAYSTDENENHRTFSAALKPECPICQVEVKEAVLDPCRHLAACCSCAESLPSCPFCACSVEGYGRLESREGFERMLALEDEGAGLRAQLQRFSRRIRELVTANGDLKLDVRRAKADALILTAERCALEERFLARPASPSPPPPAEGGDITADSDCGSPGVSLPPADLVRSNAEPWEAEKNPIGIWESSDEADGIGKTPVKTGWKSGLGDNKRDDDTVPTAKEPQVPSSAIGTKADANYQASRDTGVHLGGRSDSERTVDSDGISGDERDRPKVAVADTRSIPFLARQMSYGKNDGSTKHVSTGKGAPLDDRADGNTSNEHALGIGGLATKSGEAKGLHAVSEGAYDSSGTCKLDPEQEVHGAEPTLDMLEPDSDIRPAEESTSSGEPSAATSQTQFRNSTLNMASKPRAGRSALSNLHRPGSDINSRSDRVLVGASSGWSSSDSSCVEGGGETASASPIEPRTNSLPDIFDVTESEDRTGIEPGGPESSSFDTGQAVIGDDSDTGVVGSGHLARSDDDSSDERASPIGSSLGSLSSSRDLLMALKEFSESSSTDDELLRRGASSGRFGGGLEAATTIGVRGRQLVGRRRWGGGSSMNLPNTPKSTSMAHVNESILRQDNESNSSRSPAALQRLSRDAGNSSNHMAGGHRGGRQEFSGIKEGVIECV